MRRDAERDGLPRWATANDDRVTRVGRFIRKCRIDELPQLFNVLKGDMSLIGPRPKRPFFVDQLTRDIPFYAVRHQRQAGRDGLGPGPLPGTVRRWMMRSTSCSTICTMSKNHTCSSIQLVLFGDGAGYC